MAKSEFVEVTTKKAQAEYVKGLVDLANMRINGELSSTAATKVFQEMFKRHQQEMSLINAVDSCFDNVLEALGRGDG